MAWTRSTLPLRHRPLGRVTAVVLLGSVVLLVLTFPLASATPGLKSTGVPAGPPPGEPVTWTNDEIYANFSHMLPAVDVTPTSGNISGLTAMATGIDEFSPSGAAVAYSDLTQLRWTIADLDTPALLTLQFTAQVVVLPANGSDASPGSANATFTFSTAPAGSTSASNESYVKIGFGLSHWPWASAADTLGLSILLTVTTHGREHLNPYSNASPEIDEVSNASQLVSEYFRWEPTAGASYANGSTATLTVRPALQYGSQATGVTLEFGGSAGGYVSLRYDPRIGLAFPLGVPSIPPYQYGLVGLGAVLVSLVAAVALRHARHRPWSLGAIGGAP